MNEERRAAIRRALGQRAFLRLSTARRRRAMQAVMGSEELERFFAANPCDYERLARARAKRERKATKETV